jgi:hypothetical protein
MLKIEAVGSSVTSMNVYQTTWHHTVDDSMLYNCAILNSLPYMKSDFFFISRILPV